VLPSPVSDQSIGWVGLEDVLACSTGFENHGEVARVLDSRRGCFVHPKLRAEELRCRGTGGRSMENRAAFAETWALRSSRTTAVRIMHEFDELVRRILWMRSRYVRNTFLSFTPPKKPPNATKPRTQPSWGVPKPNAKLTEEKLLYCRTIRSLHPRAPVPGKWQTNILSQRQHKYIYFRTETFTEGHFTGPSTFNPYSRSFTQTCVRDELDMLHATDVLVHFLQRQF
jgi:hypothetical protein